MNSIIFTEKHTENMYFILQYTGVISSSKGRIDSPYEN